MKGEKEKGNQLDDNGVRELHLQAAELEQFEARQKRLEKRLGQSRRFMDAMFNGVNDAVTIMDTANFKIVGVNKAFFNLFKREEKEVVGKCYYEVVRRKSSSCELLDEACPLAKTLKTGRHLLVEQIYYDKEGREMHMEVSISPLRNEKGEIYQIIHMARNITEHWQMEQKLKLYFVNLAKILSRAFSLRDPYAGMHEQKAAQLARMVGVKLGLNEERLQYLYIGSLLHDVGKVAIPETVLLKSGTLTPEEWALVRTYPQHGYELLKNADLPWPVAEMALHHHERLDGSGYPDGISDGNLCREVRIIAACSVVSAMVAHRPYRPARSREEIIEEMTKDQGQKYDARVVEILLDMIAGGEPELWGREL